MLFLKVCGIFLITLAGGVYGFSAAAALKKRVDSLRDIYSKTAILKERIVGGLELSRLLSLCYADCKAIKIQGVEVHIIEPSLTAEDRQLLEEFFQKLGLLDTQGEHTRIGLFLKLIDAQLKKAETQAAKKSRLLKTAGISAGLILGILFI